MREGTEGRMFINWHGIELLVQGPIPEGYIPVYLDKTRKIVSYQDPATEDSKCIGLIAEKDCTCSFDIPKQTQEKKKMEEKPKFKVGDRVFVTHDIELLKIWRCTALTGKHGTIVSEGENCWAIEALNDIWYVPEEFLTLISHEQPTATECIEDLAYVEKRLRHAIIYGMSKQKLEGLAAQSFTEKSSWWGMPLTITHETAPVKKKEPQPTLLFAKTEDDLDKFYDLLQAKDYLGAKRLALETKEPLEDIMNIILEELEEADEEINKLYDILDHYGIEG